LGAQDADIDVEVISLADRLLKAYPIDGYQITINSLGCAHDKKELTGTLRKRIEPRLSEFCPDCQTRFNVNVLRALDCKNEGCKRIIQELDIHESCLCPECKAHFNKVKVGLDALKIDYKVSPHLVRGLDYYTRTVFEIIHKDLDNQQNAIGAGGRYDTLIRDLGGPDLGAIGFAFGVERLLLVAKSVPAKNGQKLVYLIALGEEAEKQSIKLLDTLRRENICADSDYGAKSLKSAMRKANDSGARYVVIIGEDELKKGVLTLKDMSSGLQEEVKADEIILRLKK
jgi:histidyl-tRNA synthetase